jgi:hypothetical protein
VSLSLILPFVPATEFCVSTTGNDAHPGTKEKPFASLVRARDAARQLGAKQGRRIVLRGGNYYDVSLSLDRRDSGLAILAAPGESPALYGGRRVSGWKPDGDRFWAARAPGVSEGDWDFRCLVVNGELRPRARLPRQGFFTHLSRFDAPWHSTFGGGFRGADRPELKLRLQYREGDLGPWLEVRNAEVEVLHEWDSSLVGLAAHDPETRTLRFSNPSGYPPGAFGVQRYAVWNVREGMHELGQWYLDRRRSLLVYWPRPGEDVHQLEIVAPTRESIIQIEGSPESPVSGITLDGLRLLATSTPLRAGEWAASIFQGAVDARHVRDCSLRNLRIAAVGGQGIRMEGSVGGTVTACEITDVGAGGIYDMRGASNRILGNRLRGMGRMHSSAIGIRTEGGGQTRPELSHDNRVAHNEVSDAPYVGIEFDGLRNRFESNRISGVMQVLNDGGALYGGGRQIVLRGNVVRRLPAGKSAHAYYIDELGVDCLLEGNAAVDCEWPVHLHMSTNNTIRNNVFISGGPSRWTFPRSSGMIVERNVVLAEGAIIVENPGAVAAWKNNLFFSRAGEYRDVPEALILRADPLLEDTSGGQFGFRPDSPALGLGIRALDLRAAGPP